MTQGQRRALWVEHHRAAKERRLARAHAADDGMWPMREMARDLANARLRRAEARYERAKAAWEAAGCPNAQGRAGRRDTQHKEE